MNDTIRELLRAAFTAGENSYMSDDPVTCEDWIEALEPPSREGKVKVVVRGFIDGEGKVALGSFHPGDRMSDLDDSNYGAWKIVGHVTKPAVEVVEDVEVQGD